MKEGLGKRNLFLRTIYLLCHFVLHCFLHPHIPTYMSSHRLAWQSAYIYCSVVVCCCLIGIFKTQVSVIFSLIKFATAQTRRDSYKRDSSHIFSQCRYCIYMYVAYIYIHIWRAHLHKQLRTVFRQKKNQYRK